MNRQRRLNEPFKLAEQLKGANLDDQQDGGGKINGGHRGEKNEEKSIVIP